MNSFEKDNKKIYSENNFSGFLGGKNLETIRKAMPHHDKMQMLVGKTLEAIYAEDKSEKEIRVLEIGTGTGLTSRQILEADPRVVLTSVDSEPKMISEAERNLESYIHEGRIAIHQEDALEFLEKQKPGSFSSVASAFTIHNMEAGYRKKLLERIFVILKPGGKFINSDIYVPDDPEECEKERQWQIEQFMSADVEQKVRDAWLRHYEYDCRPGIAMAAGEAARQMEEIGFVNIVLSDRNHREALLTAEKP